MNIHATAIAIGRFAVLLRGPSASGKSDLALRLLALSPSPLMPAAPQLVADDQVLLDVRDGRLIASSPPSIAGRLEVRGVGIVSVDHVDDVEVALVVDLVDRSDAPRLPEAADRAELAGVRIRRLALHAFDASTPVKIVIALTTASGDDGGSRSNQKIRPGGPRSLG